MHSVWLRIGLSQSEQDVYWLLAIIYFDWWEATVIEGLSSIHSLKKLAIEVEELPIV
jgi:hypothetical protein